jgi:NAD-dependent SIR2 family protein deacetylase
MSKKAIVKLDGGKISLLCSECRVVIKTKVTEEEMDKIFNNKLPPQYCEKCKKYEEKIS